MGYMHILNPTSPAGCSEAPGRMRQYTGSDKVSEGGEVGNDQIRRACYNPYGNIALDFRGFLVSVFLFDPTTLLYLVLQIGHIMLLLVLGLQLIKVECVHYM